MGTAQSVTSSSVRPIRSAMQAVARTTGRQFRTTPLGRPVLPEV